MATTPDQKRLFLYLWGDGTVGYVGKGSKKRAKGIHPDEVLKIRQDPAYRELFTEEPFSTKEDARKAEAIAIWVLAHAPSERKRIRNRSGRKHTEYLKQSLFTRPGQAEYESFANTLFVKVGPDKLADIPLVGGAGEATEMAERCRQFWDVSESRAKKLQRLVALSTKEVTPAGSIVLGSWAILPSYTWGNDEKGYRAIELADPTDWDSDGNRGKEFVAKDYKFRTVGYSKDVR